MLRDQGLALARDLGEHPPLGGAVDLRVGEHVAQRRGGREGGDEVAQLAAHGLHGAGVLGGVEERAGVDGCDLLFAQPWFSMPS